MKGKSYNKVISWFDLVQNNKSILIKLFEQEPGQMKHTLDVLKSGLFSNSVKVVLSCISLFTSLLDEIDNGHQSSRIESEFDEWMTVVR